MFNEMRHAYSVIDDKSSQSGYNSFSVSLSDDIIIVTDTKSKKDFVQSEIQSSDSYLSKSCSTSISKSQSCPKKSSLSGNRPTFQPIITPLTNVMTNYGRNKDCPTFTLYKTGDLISLSWEPFNGKVAESGAEGLLVSQSIIWLPDYPQEYPMIMYHKGNRENGLLKISLGVNYQIQMLFPRGICVRSGDSISVPGSTVSWLIGC